MTVLNTSGNRPAGSPATPFRTGAAVAADPRHDTAGTVLGLAAVTTGLTAGVYFSYGCSVMLALGKVDDRTFIDVMQHINTAIQNPVFFAGFFGAFISTAAAVVQQRRRGRRKLLAWTAAALALYTVGLLTTMAINVPLNNDLAAAGDPAHIADPGTVREHFENTWNTWNAARALVSTAALGCLAKALTLHGRFRRQG